MFMEEACLWGGWGDNKGEDEKEGRRERAWKWDTLISKSVGQSKHPAKIHFSTLAIRYCITIIRYKVSASVKCIALKGPAPVTEGHYRPSSILHDRWRCKSRHILKSGHFHCPRFIFPLHVFEPSGLSCRPSAITTTKQLRRFCHFQPSADKDVTAGWGRSCRFLGDSWLTPWERRCRADDCFHTQQHK